MRHRQFSGAVCIGNKVAVTDPVYSFMLTQCNGKEGKFRRKIPNSKQYLPCVEQNNFVPEIPKEKLDIVYLCYPNNPTGMVSAGMN